MAMLTVRARRFHQDAGSQVTVKFKIGLRYNAASSTAASPTVESFVNSYEMLENQENNNNGDAVEPKTIWKNSFRPPVIEDWNSDDDGKVEFIPNVEDKTIRPSIEKIKFVKSARKTVEEDTTARDRAVVSKNKGKEVNAVKASTCWGNPQQKEYKEKGVIKNGKGRISGKVLRKDNIYSVDLKSVVPTKGLTCLFAKAIIDESNLWHRRSGYINFKNMTKLMRGNLVRGLPSKIFENDHSCVACQKGKQHKASYHKEKVIRCDNGTEFKNNVMNQFCEMKGIKREFNIGRTSQHNGVAERRNRTLIEDVRTMLVDSKLPTTFWAEVVNTACYVLNRVLVINPHTKTAYKLISGRTPLIDFMKPLGCPVTILNTRDNLGKFDEKANEGFFVGYFVVSKAIRVFNKRTRIVKETLNIRFLENAPNVVRAAPLLPREIITISLDMSIVGTKIDNIVAGPKDSKEDARMKPIKVNESRASDKGEGGLLSRPRVKFLKEEVDMNNIDTSYTASDVPFTKFLKDHPQEQVIGSLKTPIQTRHMTKINEEDGLISSVHKLRRTTHKDFQNCLFACFFSQKEPKKVIQALEDPSWVEAMQDELL
ncbi:retrovirus-related pol polyprotein from transposon TNT 1-94 [Tanacetum coccineum]